LRDSSVSSLGVIVNTISPGIVTTPLAKDELTGPRGEGYRRMIEGPVAGHAGTVLSISDFVTPPLTGVGGRLLRAGAQERGEELLFQFEDAREGFTLLRGAALQQHFDGVRVAA